ncbi:MAG: NADPH:quinone oxidoreductase family protein [Gammaproteobacteria bacterium]|nr:NADPH:quinone oxidoreductase family protein [Gammaproteobacteria bacterium]
MKAMLSITPGGPQTLQLQDAALPEPGAGEVRIRVRACGVNYPDTLIIEDKYQFRPTRPFSPGGEVAGEIDAVGDGVDGLAVGDRVIGMVGWGGMAEYVVTRAVKCAPIPAGMPWDEAAAFVFTYGTSYHALKQRGELGQGDTLLVLGAAGGVGLAAVELGRAMGARVIAAASSAEKVALAKAHGAADGVVYPPGPFDKDGAKALATLFKDAVGADGANVVYDGVGGAYAEAALRAIAWEGRFLVVGFPAGIPAIPLNLPLLKGCQIVGVFLGSWSERDPAANQQNINELVELYAAGKIKPHVSAHYPLAEAGQAITDLAERRALGKIVVMIDA